MLLCAPAKYTLFWETAKNPESTCRVVDRGTVLAGTRVPLLNYAAKSLTWPIYGSPYANLSIISANRPQ
ncbi:MAG: hypothetical protein QOK23_4619 [Gammaproteobacteria bacterium]|jgi:hypothetical protein|nr:hypothetical protein [Gammaproteobacteria bacterium]